MFFMGQTIILLNEVFLGIVGIVDYNLELFLSSDFRNPSFVFGPFSEFESIVEAFSFLIPNIFKQNIFGIAGVGDFYWPVIWLLIPVVLFFPVVYFVGKNFGILHYLETGGHGVSSIHLDIA